MGLAPGARTPACAALREGVQSLAPAAWRPHLCLQLWAGVCSVLEALRQPTLALLSLCCLPGNPTPSWCLGFGSGTETCLSWLLSSSHCHTGSGAGTLTSSVSYLVWQSALPSLTPADMGRHGGGHLLASQRGGALTTWIVLESAIGEADGLGARSSGVRLLGPRAWSCPHSCVTVDTSPHPLLRLGWVNGSACSCPED